MAEPFVLIGSSFVVWVFVISSYVISGFTDFSRNESTSVSHHSKTTARLGSFPYFPDSYSYTNADVLSLAD